MMDLRGTTPTNLLSKVKMQREWQGMKESECEQKADYIRSGINSHSA